MSAAQIGLFHGLILQQFGSGAGGYDLAGLQHVAPVGHGQSHVGVLLHQQDGGAVLVQFPHDVEDLLHQDGGQAHGGLIQTFPYMSSSKFSILVSIDKLSPFTVGL